MDSTSGSGVFFLPSMNLIQAPMKLKNISLRSFPCLLPGHGFSMTMYLHPGSLRYSLTFAGFLPLAMILDILIEFGEEEEEEEEEESATTGEEGIFGRHVSDYHTRKLAPRFRSVTLTTFKW